MCTAEVFLSIVRLTYKQENRNLKYNSFDSLANYF